MSFYVQNHPSRPKIDPLCQFQHFPSRGRFFHFQNFLDLSMRKEQHQPPSWSILLNVFAEHVLRIKLKVTKFRHHRIRGFWMAAANLQGNPGPVSLPPPPAWSDKFKKRCQPTRLFLLVYMAVMWNSYRCQHMYKFTYSAHKQTLRLTVFTSVEQWRTFSETI